MTLKGIEDIKFIQGDTFTYRLSFADSIFSEIEKVVFSSSKLGICENFLVNDDNIFYLVFEISDFVGSTSFDVSLYLNSGDKVSSTNNIITITKKENPDCEEVSSG